MEVSPNLLPPEFPSTTSVKLSWSINGDTPQTITVMDECSGKALWTGQGGGGGAVTLANLPAKQQYRLFLVANYPDGPFNSNVVDRYPNQPCGAAKTQTATTDFPALSTQNFPKTLNSPNRIVVSCANAGTYVHWIISVNGVQQSQQMVGDETFTFDSTPGGAYTLNADGELRATSDYTNWGPPIPVKAGPNSNSVMEFLKNSGVNGTGGLRGFVRSSSSTSVRNMLGL